MNSITIVIPTYNEQSNISDCIKSVKWADKIIVFHMGSDNSGTIAKKLGAEVIEKFKTEKPDFKLVQRAINWAIDNCKTEWMLRLDADERVTPELQKEIASLLHGSIAVSTPTFNSSPFIKGEDQGGEFIMKQSIVAYGIPRSQYFLGTFLKGGDWYYDRLVRLFKPKCCRYDPIVSVHEQFKVNGKISYLKNPLLHYSHPTLNDVIKKFNIYTDVEINDLNISKLHALFNLLTQPPYIFARWMIYHHGWRDGGRGVLAGLLRGYYSFLLFKKYLFSFHSAPPNEPSLTS